MEDHEVDPPNEPPMDELPASASDTTLRIIDAASELIAEVGEEGLRISDVVTRSGCSVGTIYHHFGSRTRLVETVRSQHFDASSGLSPLALHVTSLADALASATTPDEFMGPVADFVRQVSGDDMLDDLWRTVDLIGLAYSKPGVRSVVADSLRRQTEAYQAALSVLQERGVVDPSLDPWAVAVFAQAFMLGRIIGLIDGTDNLQVDAWTEVVMRFVSAILTPEQAADRTAD